MAHEAPHPFWYMAGLSHGRFMVPVPVDLSSPYNPDYTAFQVLCDRKFEPPGTSLKRAQVTMYCVKGLVLAALRKFAVRNLHSEVLRIQ